MGVSSNRDGLKRQDFYRFRLSFKTFNKTTVFTVTVILMFTFYHSFLHWLMTYLTSQRPTQKH